MQRCHVSDFVRGDLVSLRPWGVADAQWYADESKDPDIQRFTSDPADLSAKSVAAAIEARHGGSGLSFLVVDAATGHRLGNLAVDLEGSAGMVSYWMSSSARGRGSATSAIKLLVGWLHDRADPWTSFGCGPTSTTARLSWWPFVLASCETPPGTAGARSRERSGKPWPSGSTCGPNRSNNAVRWRIRDRSPILLRVTFTDAHAPVTAPWSTPVAHWSAQLAVGSRQNALMSLRLCILLWECAERARVPVEDPRGTILGWPTSHGWTPSA